MVSFTFWFWYYSNDFWGVISGLKIFSKCRDHFFGCKCLDIYY